MNIRNIDNYKKSYFIMSNKTYINPNAIKDDSIKKNHLYSGFTNTLATGITINNVTKTGTNPSFTGLVDTVVVTGTYHYPNSNGTVNLGNLVNYSHLTGTTATSSYHTAHQLKANIDLRSENTNPSDYNHLFKISGLKYNSALTLPNEGVYSTVLGARSWGDKSGGPTHEFALTYNGNVCHRYGNEVKNEDNEIIPGGWEEWERIITNKHTASTSDYGITKLVTSTGTSQTLAATQSGMTAAYKLAETANAKANDAYTKATTPATTAVAGVVQLSNSTSSNAENVAATPKAVKSAYDKATANTASINTLRNDFNTLVSGNTDATINNFREITNFLEQFNTGDTLAKTLANLEPTYKSDLSGNIKMYNAVGGISSGTKVSSLTGKTVNDILDDLLFPLLTPKSTDHTDPSITGFELDPNNSPVLINSNVTKNVSNAVFNPGKWTKYDTSINYAGPITSSAYTFTINGTAFTKTSISSITGSTSFPSQYTTPGDHEYKVTINYEKGPYPLNSRGIQYTGLTAPASSITLTKNINVTYPWFATTVTAGELTQQSTLIKWTTSDMNTGEFELKPHTTTASQKFSIPRSVKTISLFDTASGNWKADSLSNWTLTNENKTINGKANCPYYTYTFNGADKRGSVKIKVTF